MGLSSPAGQLAWWTQTQRQRTVHRVVAAVLLGNSSCRSRSFNSCQSLAEVRMLADVHLVGFGCYPDLTKTMACLEDRDNYCLVLRFRYYVCWLFWMLPECSYSHSNNMPHRWIDYTEVSHDLYLWCSWTGLKFNVYSCLTTNVCVSTEPNKWLWTMNVSYLSVTILPWSNFVEHFLWKRALTKTLKLI